MLGRIFLGGSFSPAGAARYTLPAAGGHLFFGAGGGHGGFVQGAAKGGAGEGIDALESELVLLKT